uniref:Uncharacterized protein n=1 Tax=Salix viminalis TaxID=40686 RepID=A0A6N2K4H1_SALVM
MCLAVVRWFCGGGEFCKAMRMRTVRESKRERRKGLIMRALLAVEEAERAARFRNFDGVLYEEGFSMILISLSLCCERRLAFVWTANCGKIPEATGLSCSWLN